MLRQEIQKLVVHSASPEEAALLIVLYLEDAGLSLEGNGWLDDDSKWDRLNSDDGEGMDTLRRKLETILA